MNDLGESCETITSNQFQMDKKKRQVTLLGPDRTPSAGPADRNSTATLSVTETNRSSDHTSGKDQEGGKGLDVVLAPRMFAFDGVFTGNLYYLFNYFLSLNSFEISIKVFL